LQTEENVAGKKLLLVLWCSYRQYQAYRRKTKTGTYYEIVRKMLFTSEIDML